MNHVLRKLTNRRCALKNNNRGMYGGGLAVNTLAPYMSSNQVPIESRTYTDDCYYNLRPGEVHAEPNPELAQTAMAGGAIAKPIGRSSRLKTRRMKGAGCGCMFGRRKQTGGRCPCLDGGARRKRTQRGGNKGGFGVDPSLNVGGDGPNAAPTNVPIPCEGGPAGSPNPLAPQVSMGADLRAYGVGYSVTSNQTAPIVGGGYVDTRAPNFNYAVTQAGGAYGSGFEGPDCYKPTGSQMPVYPAQSSGFDFTPSTAAGASYSDGVTPFMEVNHRVARVGGGRHRRYHTTRKNKKTKRR